MPPTGDEHDWWWLVDISMDNDDACNGAHLDERFSGVGRILKMKTHFFTHQAPSVVEIAIIAIC